MLLNGSAANSATMLDPSIVIPWEPPEIPPAAAKHTKINQKYVVSQTAVDTWVVDNLPFQSPDVPLIEGNKSDGWRAATTKHFPGNTTIDIILQIANDSLDQMGHPMHMHGHKFWVLGSGTGQFNYSSIEAAPSSLMNLPNPPYRDVALLPPSGWLAIRYITDNPGAWMLHCHVQWHLLSGMAVVLVEDSEKLTEIIQSAVQPGSATSSHKMKGTSIASKRSPDILERVLLLTFGAGWIMSDFRLRMPL